jgi:hypothetical protein
MQGRGRGPRVPTVEGRGLKRASDARRATPVAAALELAPPNEVLP